MRFSSFLNLVSNWLAREVGVGSFFLPGSAKNHLGLHSISHLSPNHSLGAARGLPLGPLWDANRPSSCLAPQHGWLDKARDAKMREISQNCECRMKEAGIAFRTGGKKDPSVPRSTNGKRKKKGAPEKNLSQTLFHRCAGCYPGAGSDWLEAATRGGSFATRGTHLEASEWSGERLAGRLSKTGRTFFSQERDEKKEGLEWTITCFKIILHRPPRRGLVQTYRRFQNKARRKTQIGNPHFSPCPKSRGKTRKDKKGRGRKKRQSRLNRSASHNKNRLS
ncbi:hypothetical protein MAPG_05207 [Magnaporthiopsis poae ATCC 64411]|uniref:Uncharacterized protein n=1 Tax=Magnaporthiopsis poae (strain ATCC 64411 / 73-15) TaxID=644358 RepID=A0A0C4DYS8_MAGP6|nr:hypothetical protein MAPG_05207 [Magnaporthiopsis poae ATCC 64411]